MDINKEREDFEAWYEQHHNGRQISCDYVEEDNSYSVGYANAIWVGWQAAKANPAWISISERMPNEGEEVFVHHFGHVVQATKDEKYLGGFKQRNCYGWEAVSSYISHWIPANVELPQSFNFYYENDAKQKAMIEAQEQSHE